MNTKRAAAMLDRFIFRIAFPSLAVSATLLHCYTAYTAFGLANTTFRGFLAALAAWLAPPLSQFAVAYFTWRATGSVVNYYSFWLYAWVGCFAAVAVTVVVNRLLLSQPRSDGFAEMGDLGLASTAQRKPRSTR